ncbi:SAM-dependent methyltransferase [Verrucomicrobia bacterium LW23]|nr:SAM-dependent methyltransferase [Verrucomicrobia bacterium LW23]
MTSQTKEPQYQFLLEKQEYPAQFGLMSGQVWQDDPRRLVFLLSRYKFVSKMLSGADRVLEVGCADAFGTRIVKQEVKHITVTDFDPVFIEDAKTRHDPRWPVDYKVHDMLEGPVEGGFDAAYCCDVIEHIMPSDEKVFVDNLAKSLKPTGTLIVGSPSLESQTYASPPSKAGHVNCKTAKDLKALMQLYFHQVFIFSMNDEVVHTGFYPMAHYLFALCCHRK